MASNCQADGEAQDSLLGKWSIEYSFDSVAFAKSMSAAENTSEFDIFAEDFGTEWDVSYVWSVSRATSMPELMAWKRFQWVRWREAGMSFAKV